MENFISLAKQRCSIRKYNNQKVEEDKLLQILEAGRIAPSSRNQQPWHYLVLDHKTELRKLEKAANTFKAPLCIVVFGNKDQAWVRNLDGKNSVDIDTTIAATQMLLQAEESGLSTCWICAFNPQLIKEEFGVPQELEPIHILAIGYADEPKKPANRHSLERKSLGSIMSRNGFNS